MLVNGASINAVAQYSFSLFIAIRFQVCTRVFTSRGLFAIDKEVANNVSLSYAIPLYSFTAPKEIVTVP